MSVQRLADLIASAVIYANSTRGMAERAIVSGDTVVTTHGAYAYDVVCPINLYDGKEVWIQLTEDDIAVIIGD